MNGPTFPPPFSGLELVVEFADVYSLLHAAESLTCHAHNYAVQLDAPRPGLWVSEMAADCLKSRGIS